MEVEVGSFDILNQFGPGFGKRNKDGGKKTPGVRNRVEAQPRKRRRRFFTLRYRSVSA